MPLNKRILFDLDSYHTLDALQENDQPLTLEARSLGRMIAACRQLSYLTAFALEIFQNVSALADDVNERVKIVSKKTEKLTDRVLDVEKHLRNCEAVPDLYLHNPLKHLKNRDIAIPPLFTKQTNAPAIALQYSLCRAPPQLWRIEDLTGTECYSHYSHPGYFFQSWLRSELIRQEEAKKMRKKNKAIRKQQRRKRKKLLLEKNKQQTLLQGNGQSILLLGKGTTLLQNKEMQGEGEKRREEPSRVEYQSTAETAADWKMSQRDLGGAVTGEEEGGREKEKEKGKSKKMKGLAKVFNFLSKRDTVKRGEEAEEREEPTPLKESEEVGGQRQRGEERQKAEGGKERKGESVRKEEVKVEKSKEKEEKKEEKREEKKGKEEKKERESKAPLSLIRTRHPSPPPPEPTPQPQPVEERAPSPPQEGGREKKAPVSGVSRAETTAMHLLLGEREKTSGERGTVLSTSSSSPLLSHLSSKSHFERTIEILAGADLPPPPPPPPKKKTPLALSAPPVSMRLPPKDKQLLISKPATEVEAGTLPSSPVGGLLPPPPPPSRKRQSIFFSPDALSRSLERRVEEEAEAGERSAHIFESVKKDYLKYDGETRQRMDTLTSLDSDPLLSYKRPSMVEMIVEEGEEPEGEDELPPLPEEDPEEEEEVEYAGRGSTSTMGGIPPPSPRPSTSVTSVSLQSVRVSQPEPPSPENPMMELLNSIKQGKAVLRSTVHVPPPPPTVMQNEAIAAILANRSKIAGDSDSDDSDDSDYTDDEYG